MLKYVLHIQTILLTTSVKNVLNIALQAAMQIIQRDFVLIHAQMELFLITVPGDV